jgi:nitrogen regulatory protein P-II 1
MSRESKALIVTIVRKGWGDLVLEASIKAGASGGTVIFGRGKGVHEQQKIMGICIEPEKEIVLTLISRKEEDMVLAEIVRVAELDKPGCGITFVIPVEKVVGMVHVLTEPAPASM